MKQKMMTGNDFVPAFDPQGGIELYNGLGIHAD